MVTSALFDMLKTKNAVDVRGKHCLVVGSERPWVEATLLAAGAAHVTTLEYGAANTDHPQLTTITPHAFRKMRICITGTLFSDRENV